MSRNWMVTVWICAVAVSLLFLGCPKKKPTTVEDLSTDTEIVVVEEEVPAPTPPPVVDETPDPLAGDLVEAMEYAYREGFLGDVYFDFDKYDLKSDARERLAKNAEFMKAHPEFIFTIEGHCDDRGTSEYNIALGESRANAAKGYLESLSTGSTARTISYGEERPLCTEATESCWWRNRRAHFVISGRTGG